MSVGSTKAVLVIFAEKAMPLVSGALKITTDGGVVELPASATYKLPAASTATPVGDVKPLVNVITGGRFVAAAVGVGDGVGVTSGDPVGEGVGEGVGVGVGVDDGVGEGLGNE